MQLLIGTARSAARDLGMPSPDLHALGDPATNIALGTGVLASESRRFGRVDLALAAYNAGQGPVQRWLAKRGGMEADAFIEEIPYTETRNYVKTVLQSAAMYRWLYRDGHPSSVP
jgi:soluble lytic murein transglycosylase